MTALRKINYDEEDLRDVRGAGDVDGDDDDDCDDAGFDDAGDDVDEDDGENGGSDCQDFSDTERENDHEPLVSSWTLLGRKCNSRAFFLRRAVG